jgi:hypothetical protein
MAFDSGASPGELIQLVQYFLLRNMLSSLWNAPSDANSCLPVYVK